MLNNRGYEFVEKDDDNNTFLFKKDKHSILVFFTFVKKFNINLIKEYIELLKTIEIDHAIIIYNKSMTSSAKKVIDKLLEIEIEVFVKDELMFDLTQNKYYFPHLKLNEDDKKQFIEKYGTKIPIVFETDPVCRYFNYKKGDILEIHRKNNYISYRMVK